MGQTESEEKTLLVEVIQYTLKIKGPKVNSNQITEFLNFTQTVNPWFPNHGALDSES